MASEYCTRRRVEFADTDMAGIAHFSRFFVWMEAAEHEFLRTLGVSVHMEYGGDVISWPRLSASCEFFRPVHFEDELEIHLQVERKGSRSLSYEFSFAKEGEEVARGKLRVACCACNPGEEIRSIPIPEFISEHIEEAQR